MWVTAIILGGVPFLEWRLLLCFNVKTGEEHHAQLSRPSFHSHQNIVGDSPSLHGTIRGNAYSMLDPQEVSSKRLLLLSARAVIGEPFFVMLRLLRQIQILLYIILGPCQKRLLVGF